MRSLNKFVFATGEFARGGFIFRMKTARAFRQLQVAGTHRCTHGLRAKVWEAWVPGSAIRTLRRSSTGSIPSFDQVLRPSRIAARSARSGRCWCSLRTRARAIARGVSGPTTTRREHVAPRCAPISGPVAAYFRMQCACEPPDRPRPFTAPG